MVSEFGLHDATYNELHVSGIVILYNMYLVFHPISWHSALKILGTFRVISFYANKLADDGHHKPRGFCACPVLLEHCHGNVTGGFVVGQQCEERPGSWPDFLSLGSTEVGFARTFWH